MVLLLSPGASTWSSPAPADPPPPVHLVQCHLWGGGYKYLRMLRVHTCVRLEACVTNLLSSDLQSNEKSNEWRIRRVGAVRVGPDPCVHHDVVAARPRGGSKAPIIFSKGLYDENSFTIKF